MLIEIALKQLSTVIGLWNKNSDKKKFKTADYFSHLKKNQIYSIETYRLNLIFFFNFFWLCEINACKISNVRIFWDLYRTYHSRSMRNWYDLDLSLTSVFSCLQLLQFLTPMKTDPTVWRGLRTQMSRTIATPDLPERTKTHHRILCGTSTVQRLEHILVRAWDVRFWPFRKLPFECQKIAKHLYHFLAIFFFKWQVFANFLTFK